MKAKTKDIRQTALRLPADLLRKVKVYCAERDITMVSFITSSLKEGLKANGRSSRANRK